MHVESNRILNKIETSAQQRFSNLSLSLLPCDGYHGHARITISLHHLSCQFENLMKYPLQYPFQMHLFNICSNVFALSLLNSVHEIVFFRSVFSYNPTKKAPDGNTELHVEGDPYHDSSNPQSAEWFRWRHLQPVISPDVFEFRKLKTKCQKKSEKRLLF